MDEVIVLDGGRSFGVLTRAQQPARRKAVVLFNAGLIHRTGPFRLHVHLARELARQGFDVLRFDLPGMGDAPLGTHANQESAVAEAMDTVQAETGSGDFIVGGVCTAADLGWKIAAAEPRVSGVLLLDGMAVQNKWFRVGQLGLLLKRPLLSWPGMVARFFKAKPEDAPGVMDFRDWPDPASFKQQLGSMLGRGVKVLAFYTGGISYYLLHSRQLDATFGKFRSHANLEVEYRPGLDHILFSPLDRQQVIERVCEWSRSV